MSGSLFCRYGRHFGSLLERKLEALLVIGFSEEDRRSLYRIFSMVLLLGNARFDEKREVVAESTGRAASELNRLGLQRRTLNEASSAVEALGSS